MTGTPAPRPQRPRPPALRFVSSALAALALLGASVVLAPGPAAASASASDFASVSEPEAGSWAWPVAPPHPILRPYLAPATRYSAGHRGVDIAASAGGPVFAPADGVVHFAGVVVDRPVLSIEHPGGQLTSYEPVVTSLVAGDAVRRGQEIGRVQPGHCPSGTCVHFGVRVDGEYVSPLLYLGGVPRAVLLPMDR